MGTRLRWWRCAVAIVVATVVATDVARKDNPTPGMDLLHQFLNNDPGQLCNYIQCQEPLRASECPEGTTYQEKVTQMGCCGACVRYKREYCAFIGVFVELSSVWCLSRIWRMED
nr:uncharacterized protein LOC128703586 [Cherax quadricarinatus]